MELLLLGALIWMLGAGAGAGQGLAGAVRGAVVDAPREASKERQGWLAKNKDAPALVRAAHRGGLVVGAVRYGPRAARDGWLGGWRGGNDRVRDWADRHSAYVYNRPQPPQPTPPAAPAAPPKTAPTAAPTAASQPPKKTAPTPTKTTPPPTGRVRLRSVPTGTAPQGGTPMTLITTAHMGIVTTTTQNLAEVGSALVEDRDEKEDAAQAWRAAVAVAQQNEVWLDALTRNQAPTEWQAWVKQLIELDSRIKAAETARHRAADTAVAAAIDQKAAAVADHALIGVVAGEWYQ